MAEVLLFHHAQGLTSGISDFAAELREAGHIVHVPDLYEGKVFDELSDGRDYAERVGFDEIRARGVAAARELDTHLVYAGFSLGVMPAQQLAQTRAGARGALLFHSCLPVSAFSNEWPQDVPAQIHGMDADDMFVTEGDLDAARQLVESVPDAELFLYPGDAHLFADSSLPSFDERATQLLLERVLGLLDEV